MSDLPGPDCVAVHPFPFSDARKIFTGPTANESLVSMRYFQRPDGGLIALATFGPLCEGAPGQVHGGMILTVLDEALGAAAWLEGHPVLTVRLETEFRKSVPVGAKLLVETRLVSFRHRIAVVEGSLLDADGKTYAKAAGRFLELDAQAQRRIFGPR